MNNDLIRKSEVINLLCNLHIDNLAVNDKRVTEYIREIPIAYDVEKVDEQILQYYNSQVEEGRNIADLVNDEIEIRRIVRNGGKE